MATGVSLPVRPTWTSISRTTVAACAAGYLKAMAQRGNLRGEAELLLEREVVHLDDHAVDRVLEALPPVGPLVAEGEDLVEPRALARRRVGPQAPGPHPVEGLPLTLHADLPGVGDQYRKMSSPRRATIRESRFFMVPAAALRGLAKGSSSASARSRLIASNRERGR